MGQSRKSHRGHPHKARAPGRYAGWKLEDAKARFSEVARRAAEGPQRVTVRGRDAVVVVAADEFERMLPRAAEPQHDHQKLPRTRSMARPALPPTSGGAAAPTLEGIMSGIDALGALR